MKFRKVEIKWLDAQTGFGESLPISRFKEGFEPFYNYSMGYLVENNKDYIIVGFLIMNVDSGEYEPTIKHWHLIPRGMIKKMRYIK